MNARQKAKKYKQRLKQLEDMMCPTKQIFIDRTELRHYRTCYRAYSYERPDVALQHATHKLITDVSEILSANIEMEQDDYSTVYTLDLWLKR